MRSTSLTFRLTTHALLLAFAAFALVVIGCTGAQASPTQSATAQLSTTQISTAQSAAQVPAAQGSPKCVPGRDKVKVERNAVAPNPAHLQPAPANPDSGLAGRAWADTAVLQFSSRDPAALSHLDLGIVRT